MELHISEPIHNLHSCHLGYFVHERFVHERGIGWGKRLTGIYRMGHPIHPIGQPLVRNHRRQKYLHNFCLLEGISQYSPYYWTLRNFTDVEDLFIFISFFPLLMAYKYLTNKSRVVAISCLPGLINTISSM